MDIPPRRFNEIVHGKRTVTADTAPLRFAHAPVLQNSSGWVCRLTTIWKKSENLLPGPLKSLRMQLPDRDQIPRSKLRRLTTGMSGHVQSPLFVLYSTILFAINFLSM